MGKLGKEIENRLNVTRKVTAAGKTPRTPKALSAHLTSVANLLGEKPVSVTAEFGRTFDSTSAPEEPAGGGVGGGG